MNDSAHPPSNGEFAAWIFKMNGFIRLFMIGCFFGALIQFSHANAGEATDPASPTINIQRFMETTPLIKLLVWRVRGIRDGASGEWEYYEARLQTNAFFIRVIDQWPASETNRTEFGVLAGYYGDYNWILFKDFLHYYVDTTNNPSRVNDRQSFRRQIQFQEMNLSQILNFGIPDLSIGNIKWQGNHFQTVSPLSSNTYSGIFKPAIGSKPKGMDFTISNPREIFKHEITYQWNEKFRPLPQKIIISAARDTSSKPYREIEILEFEPGSQPLPEERFMPDKFIIPGVTHFVMLSNSTDYSVEGTALVRVGRAPPPIQPTYSDILIRGNGIIFILGKGISISTIRIIIVIGLVCALIVFINFLFKAYRPKDPVPPDK